MARKSSYGMRKKLYTPPPELIASSDHLRTLQRANIIFAKALEQELQKCDGKIGCSRRGVEANIAV